MKINKLIAALGLAVGCTLKAAAADAAAPAPAAAPLTVEQRLNLMEKNLQTLQKENAELKTQLGWNGKAPLVVVKPAGKETSFKIGGFIQANAEAGGAPDQRFNGINDRFYVRRARVNFSGNFLENFDYKLEADFGANSLSQKTNFGGQLTDAYVNWNRYSFANVKIGQFKTPYGYEQLMSDTKLLTIERSLPNDRLTDGRQIGVAVNGDLFTNRLSYSVGAFNGTSVNNSYNDNNNFMLAARVSSVLFNGLLAQHAARFAMGLDGLGSRDDGLAKSGFGFAGNKFTGQRSAWGVDAQANWWLFGFEGEYLQNHFDQTVGSTVNANGWSLCGTAMVWPKYLQALVKYETFDPNLGVAGNNQHVWTFGLNYFIKGDDLKLSVNYLIGNNATATQAYQSCVMARMQVVF